MKKVEAYRSDNGQLEGDLRRAKAHDLAYALEQAKEKNRPGGTVSMKSKVDWHVSMELLEHAALVAEHLGEFLIEQEKLDASKAEKV